MPADQATAETAPETASASTASGNEERSRITYGEYTFQADYSSWDALTGEIEAHGDVHIISPDGIFTTDSARYNLNTRTGCLVNALGVIDPFRLRAQSIRIDEQHGKHAQGVSLTTCTHERPHYELLTQDLTLSPDDKYRARRVSLALFGKRLFTLPGFRGSLKGDGMESVHPTVTVGASGIDGAYVGVNYDVPIGEHSDLLATARFGTRGVLRGGLYATHPFRLFNGVTTGEVALLTTYREDVENTLLDSRKVDNIRLRDLTISRLPAVQISVEPMKLPEPLEGASLLVGGGFGRYHEDPTDVVENRAQAWGIVKTPTYAVGEVRLRGEVGLRRSFYSGNTHETNIWQVTAESPSDNKVYYNVSYLHRSERGETPFLFDRVLVPDELFTEIEVPLTKKGQWRLGAWNRYDLDKGSILNYNLAAIYRQDCLSYGLLYNHASQSVGVGMVINAFGSFHKGVPSINFTQ